MDLETKRQFWSHSFSSPPSALSAAGGGKVLVGHEDGTVRLLTPHSMSPPRLVWDPMSLNSVLALSVEDEPDLLVVGAASLDLVDLYTGRSCRSQAIPRPHHYSGSMTPVTAPAETTLHALGTSEGRVEIFVSSQLDRIAVLDRSDSSPIVGLVPDRGARGGFCAAQASGRLTFWDCRNTTTPLAELKGGVPGCYRFSAVAGCRDVLATSSRSQEVQLWDMSSLKNSVTAATTNGEGPTPQRTVAMGSTVAESLALLPWNESLCVVTASMELRVHELSSSRSTHGR